MIHARTILVGLSFTNIYTYRNFFLGGGRPFRKMVNIFAYTCPNRSGVGAINNPDRSEQVFDAYYISEVSKKNSWATFRWSVLRKCEFLVVFKAFISNFAYYNLYQRKLKGITWKKYAVHFSIRPLHFSLKTSEVC